MIGGVVLDFGVGGFLVLMGIAVLILTWRRGLQRIEAKLGKLSLTVEGIDKAVNNVPPTEPPLVDKVRDIHQAICHEEEQ